MDHAPYQFPREARSERPTGPRAPAGSRAVLRVVSAAGDSVALTPHATPAADSPPALSPTPNPRLHGGTSRPVAAATQQPEADATRASAEVASENRRAGRAGPSRADRDSSDRAWRLAVATTMELQGGPAAVITPEARKRIRQLATTIGARPFEAELVMAVVRDAAAHGDSPMSRDVQRRLALASGAGHRLDGARQTVEREAKKTTAAQHIVLAGCTAVLLAGWLLWIAIAWVRAG